MGDPFCKNADVYIKPFFQEKKDKNPFEENALSLWIKKKNEQTPTYTRFQTTWPPWENLVNTF